MNRVDGCISYMHRYTVKDIINYLERISKLKILIIGEAVIDEYIYGEVIGKTNKSSSLVFSPHHKEVFAGVPMNIANHLSDFCSNIELKVMIGTDHMDHFVADHVSSGVTLYHWDAPSIIKRRYVAAHDNNKVFEVYDFRDSTFDDTNLLNDLNKEISSYDLIIVGDSGHGMLTYNVRKVLKDRAKFLAINAQMNAGNIGTHSIRKYMDRTHDIYICVNQREFRLAVHENWDEYKDIDELIQSKAHDIIAITLGPEGCKISRRNNGTVTIPALISDIVDPVGAGDAFLAITSPLAFMEVPVDIIGFIGNLAGGLHSMYQGNKDHVRKDILYQYINKLLS